MTVRKVNWVFLFSLLIYLGGANAVAMLFPSVSSNIYSWNVLCEFLMILLPALWLTAKKVPVAEVFRIRRISGRTVYYTVLMLFCCYPFFSLASYLTSLLGRSASQDLAQELMQGSVAANLVFFALVPAVVEELVFRGMLYSTYRRTSALGAMFLSALMFGLMHMNLNQFSYTFFFGLFQVLVLEASDSIIASMVAHFTLNGVSVVMAGAMKHASSGLTSLSGDSSQAEAVSQIQSASWFPAVQVYFMAALAIAGLLLAFQCLKKIMAENGRTGEVLGMLGLCQDERGKIRRISKMKSEAKANGKGKNHLITFPLVLAMILCVAYMVMYQMSGVG